MGKLNAVRCDADFQRALEELANARGWSVPALFREAARQYMQGEELHRAMVDLEKRQAGSFKALHKEVRRLRHDMRVLMAVQELFIKSYYMHTPHVPEAARIVSKAHAVERWEKLLRAIAGTMQDSGSLSNITVAPESTRSDE
ncbi:ribbon-helix-helix domain-containing protein [Paracidovorax citrulli]|uniref:Ribbon-helix-helix protein CopG domain-containing protein n=2 Tax=Paracidovorax citrulli TaxID=80869 RepID=A1TJ66_PARC0|nr:ribbon-helix-helix domain-containing protein [Paracidovorax citrulli]ABM31004.1 hypothetical protein Aave_0397 [Paracidovorax citrulli AAC00-1]ATG95834.1 ribbon-helix-helix protein, CopG family [Paracidovorax citrulli]MVT29675.1 ribbon-helix-helix protein, CopG family [Paracidovorax citrulli]PVY65184.1 ribbon-helix-helix CopG family protein [Paracidovorax citrulli]QCX11081.1 hypothetical protein APS58_2250 [Paracidovorax citrulli]